MDPSEVLNNPRQRVWQAIANHPNVTTSEKTLVIAEYMFCVYNEDLKPENPTTREEVELMEYAYGVSLAFFHNFFYNS